MRRERTQTGARHVKLEFIEVAFVLPFPLCTRWRKPKVFRRFQWALKKLFKIESPGERKALPAPAILINLFIFPPGIAFVDTAKASLENKYFHELLRVSTASTSRSSRCFFTRSRRKVCFSLFFKTNEKFIAGKSL
jgi:hypothetical protein